MSDPTDRAAYSKRWEVMWNGGSEEYEVKGGDGGVLQPGQSFDAGCSAPHLRPAIEKLLGDLQGKSVIIPGCGRGYDVETFSEYCSNVTGMELAPTAVASANAYLKADKVIQGDFFAPHDATYDVGYDYTFFCAIHVSDREEWAKSWSRLLNPGGRLLCTVFPVFTDEAGNPFNSKNTGPPWPVVPQDYSDVLEKHGFELVSLEKVEESGSHAPRAGMEYVGLWRKA